MRGRGHGLRIWNAAVAHAGGRTIGLDGVVAQQDNYKKSGFVLAYSNIRYGGTVATSAAPLPEFVPLADVAFAAIAADDATVFRRRARPSCAPGSRRADIWAARSFATAGSPPGA